MGPANQLIYLLLKMFKGKSKQGFPVFINIYFNIYLPCILLNDEKNLWKKMNVYMNSRAYKHTLKSLLFSYSDPPTPFSRE